MRAHEFIEVARIREGMIVAVAFEHSRRELVSWIVRKAIIVP